jgi:hypothetical protein
MSRHRPIDLMLIEHVRKWLLNSQGPFVLSYNRLFFYFRDGI